MSRELEAKRSHHLADGPTGLAGEITMASEILRAEAPTKLETRVFELVNGKYWNLSELAQVVGISASEIYRVRQGKRRINEKFIIGAIKAFPEYELSALFFVREEGQNGHRL